MELTDDLVAVQGILISTIKTTGEFTKINYKGGNEENILIIIDKIRSYISGKNYIKDGKINNIFDNQLEEIVLFLVLNTKYKHPLNLEDYEHLINIMPQLSKCVLANVVYALELCKYYCKAIEKLPLNFAVELIEEIVPCLKKSSPEIQLRFAIMLLRTTAVKLTSVMSEKDEDVVYQLTEVSCLILQFLTGIYPGHVKNMKAVQIHQHMGYILLSLFELLLYCNKENLNLKKFIENVLKTCCTIIRNVTINVYCSWAEINEGDEPLQSIVAGKAYLIVEEFQKYKDATELVSMLGTIAKKPKTLSERIQAADVSTIIKNVYAKDQDQKAWFKALLGTNICDNKETMKCIGTFANLCDESDIWRLLNLSRQAKNDEASKLVVKCASTLQLDVLLPLIMRNFYEYKLEGLLIDAKHVEVQLKLIFSKVSSLTEMDDDFIKDICLLLLQSPDVVLKGLYSECLRNKCYAICYKRLFEKIKVVVGINGFGLDMLSQVIQNHELDANNVGNYVTLFKTLREVDYLSNNQLISLLLPLMERFLTEKAYESLGYVLRIFLDCSLKVPANSEMTRVRNVLLDTMNNCRCTFLELNIAKQQTVNYAVDIIKNLCELGPENNFDDKSGISTNPTKVYDDFSTYYKEYLLSKADSTLLKTLYRDFNYTNHIQCIRKLLQFLPRAVTCEWQSMVQEIVSICGSDTALMLLTSVMILLCKVVVSQDPNSATGNQVMIALKYCLQQYGIALQSVQVNSSLECETDITVNVCRLLKYLPESVQEEEGLCLINILTQRSLLELSNDREFICTMISIGNNSICRTLASRLVM